MPWRRLRRSKLESEGDDIRQHGEIKCRQPPCPYRSYQGRGCLHLIPHSFEFSSPHGPWPCRSQSASARTPGSNVLCRSLSTLFTPGNGYQARHSPAQGTELDEARLREARYRGARACTAKPKTSTKLFSTSQDDFRSIEKDKTGQTWGPVNLCGAGTLSMCGDANAELLVPHALRQYQASCTARASQYTRRAP
eukprot:3082787-Rhodomonas_salina.1